MPANLASCAVAILACGAALACHRTPAPSADSFRADVAGPEWTLVELGGAPAPRGSGDRAATILFTPDSGRVSGFGGCNRYAGAYHVHGDSLSLGPLIMTRMACDKGMDLEQRLSAALGQATRYALRDGRLTLLGAGGPVAAFERARP